MSVKDWAKREIELATNACDPYYKSCCESAFKALESLLKDGHSGMSIQYTKNILNRLIDCKPLAPITEEDFAGVESEIKNSPEWLEEMNLIDDIQCPRYSALFKHIYKDGTVAYKDIERTKLIEPDGSTWHSGIADEVADELFPITLPYYPSSTAYKVYGRSYMEDKNGKEDPTRVGEFNTVVLDYLITPDGQRIELNKKYKEIDNKLVLVDGSNQ